MHGSCVRAYVRSSLYVCICEAFPLSLRNAIEKPTPSSFYVRVKIKGKKR